MLGTQALTKNKWQLLGLCGPQSYFSCSVKGNLNFVSFFGNMSMYDCGLPSYRTPISWSWAVTAPLGGTGSITCLASKGIWICNFGDVVQVFKKEQQQQQQKASPILGRKTLLKSERIKTFIGHKYITYTLQIQLGITYSIVFAKSIH